MKNSFLNLDIFGFIIKYIHYFDEVVCAVPSSIPCNPKATHTPFVQSATLAHWELQRKLEELEKQRDEQLKMEKQRDEQLRKMEEHWDEERMKMEEQLEEQLRQEKKYLEEIEKLKDLINPSKKPKVQ